MFLELKSLLQTAQTSEVAAWLLTLYVASSKVITTTQGWKVQNLLKSNLHYLRRLCNEAELLRLSVLFFLFLRGSFTETLFIFLQEDPDHILTVEHIIIPDSCPVQPLSDLLATEQLHLSSWD